MKTPSSPFRRALNNFAIAFAIILIWRGIWYLLDWMDALLFFNNHSYSALGGIVIGILILYLPDKDLGELGKL